jgi:hypothetical protein
MATLTEYNEIKEEKHGRYSLFICQRIIDHNYKYISNAPFYHVHLLKDGIPFAFACGALHDKEGIPFLNNPIDPMRERAQELDRLDRNPFFKTK